ncbi:MAG: flagellar biosynthesis protein FlhF [Planctomycetaceae bacterium]
MTDVRTFRAPNMQAALDLVRQEMGGDAVILHTRQIPIRRLLPWSKPKEEVEVTAGVGVAIRPQTERKRQVTAARSDQQENRSRIDENSIVSPSFRQVAYPMTPEILQAAETTAKQISRTGSRSSNSKPTAMNAASPKMELPPTSSAPAQRSSNSGKLQQTSTGLSQGGSSSRTPQPANLKSFTPPSLPLKPPGRAGSDASHGDPNALFAHKLDTLQKMIEDLARSSHKRTAAEIPAEMFHLYTQLIDADVEDELAKELIFRIPHHERGLVGQELEATKSLLTAMVASEIHCGSTIVPERNRRKVVALVGPTGVGKTTTIAKLAANFRLRDNVRIGLVTVDTYRIAAVEQLRTYAEIIDLPMKVVTSPAEMRRALDELSGLELVLIDTGGRSPRDELKIQELKNLLSEAEVDEVHLVLGMNASLRSLESTVELFRPVNVSSLLFSKLDEAPSLGTILSLSRKFPWPISYVTTGQDVPDDIEPAHPDRLARLILGQDRLTS